MGGVEGDSGDIGRGNGIENSRRSGSDGRAGNGRNDSIGEARTSVIHHREVGGVEGGGGNVVGGVAVESCERSGSDGSAGGDGRNDGVNEGRAVIPVSHYEVCGVEGGCGGLDRVAVVECDGSTRSDGSAGGDGRNDGVDKGSRTVPISHR